MNETENGAAPAAPMPDAVPTPGSNPPGIEAAIERWWNDHFPGSAVAQLTAAWNHAFAAKEELKRRFKEFSGKEGF